MKKLIIKAIRFYQRKISPLFGPRCRYYPTCSHYAVEAVERFGAFKGSILTVLRLLRCNPLFPGGYDPVPEKGFRNKPTSRILGDTPENCEHTDFTENEKEN